MIKQTSALFVSILTELINLSFNTDIFSINSYLSSRYQTVIDSKGGISAWKLVTSGVPQGSVLGPLLFALFINDLPQVLQHSDHKLYADDTQIFLYCLPTQIHDAINNLQQDSTAVAQWAAENGL